MPCALARLFASCLHWVHKTNVRIVSEHVVVTVLSVDQLELVELHVFCCLLKVGLLGKDLILELLNELSVLRSGWSVLVHFLKLDKFGVQIAILLVHERACVAEFTLECLDLLNLLLDQLVHFLL